MHLSFVLLLGSLAPGQTAPLPNLDFNTGKLTHWDGEGFTPVAEPERGVSSADDGPKGRKALLHRTFVLPRDAGAVVFRAAAVRPDGREPGAALELVLEGPERRFAPRSVRSDKALVAAPKLLPPLKGQWREYVWNVEDLAGQNVRITLFDEDDRPGCHVVCSGFRIVPRDEFNGREFANHMVGLARDKQLPEMARYDSKRFLAVGNADDGFVEQQLYYCETLYDVFFDHFRQKGFTVREPQGKLMVAIFDSQVGFEAYLGGRALDSITGVYHPPSNRLVIYDYGQNRSYKKSKETSAEVTKKLPSTLQGERALSEFNRRVREWRQDTNVGTVIHEVAHQLSFNGGLMNRNGDVGAWLAEGLACYCEGTESGSWLGVGGHNPARAGQLAVQIRGKGELIPLRVLVEGDVWLRRGHVGTILLGYAQSWALFRMLMDERPEALKRYLAMVYQRRTPDHRLADFVEAFGDLDKVEKRYQAYMNEIIAREVK